MSNTKEKLQKIAFFYLKLKKASTLSQRTWSLWTTSLESILKLIKDILNVKDLTYNEIVNLDRMITLILELPCDYKIEFNPKSYKQNNVKKILDNIKNEQLIIRELILEKETNRQKYNNIDEWVVENNILILEQPKAKSDNSFSLSKDIYCSEYSLFLDIKTVLLTQKSSNSNKIYISDISNQIDKKLTLDIKSGKIEINESVMGLLSIVRLAKKIPEQDRFFLEEEENLRERIEREVLEKTLNYYIKWH